ncbi:MAG: Lrp/AsnC ligand binding domain-containing protein [Candidatus Hodarchaeales archaeon]
MIQKIKFLTVCLFSGLLTSIYIMIDSFTAYYLIPDPIVIAVVTMWVGIVPSALLLLLFEGLKMKKKKVGTLFDPDFKDIRFPRGKPFKYILIAASFGSISSIAYFTALDIFDASMMLPLIQFITIYLLVADFWAEREVPVSVEIQAITMITLGAILMTVGKNGFDFFSILFVFVFYNVPATLVTVFQSKARNYEDEKDKKVDSLNLRMWYVLALTVTTSLISFPLFILDSNKINVLFSIPWEGVLMLIISMLIAFIAIALYIRALAMGKMTVVNAFTSVNIIFTALFSIIGSFFLPEVYSFPFTDPLLIILRIVGALLLIIGIFSLSLTESYLYIFIELEKKAQYYTPQIMEFIGEIKGINTVTSVAGVYDLFATARIRTLGRANTLIVKKLSKIPGLKRTETRATLYHWERN